MGALVLASSAFAHSSNLTVSAVCNTATGRYDVTWTATADVPSLKPAVSVSNRSAIPVGAAVPGTFKESVPGTSTSVSAAITVRWSDAFTSRESASTSLPGTCAIARKAPTVVTAIHAGPGAADAPGAAPILAAPIGSTVHDTATVGGVAGYPVPSGSVRFDVYRGSVSCTGAATDGGTVALVAGVAHPSLDQVVPPGGLSFRARYGGDAYYLAADGPCEPLSGIRSASTTVTEIHDASHAVVTAVPVGTTVHDRAVVSGAYGPATGTVTFRWFGNGACTGNALATSAPVTLVGGAADGVAFPQTPAAAGAFAFQATYGGDSTYEPSVGPCEPLTVSRASTSVATAIHAGPGAADAPGATAILSAPVGSIVHDTATVARVTGYPVPSGTVRFDVYRGSVSCSGTASDGGTVVLVGGIAHPSADQVVPAGGLSFRARYSGDASYLPADGPCEPLTGVRSTSTTVTEIHDAAHGVVAAVAPGTTVHDRALVSGAFGPATGSVTFRWFANGTCAGPAVAESAPVALVGGAADGVAFPQTPTAAGSFAFQAAYGGDATYEPSVGPCEPLVVTGGIASVVTAIHAGPGAADTPAATPITSAPVGSVVHDTASVSGVPGLPAPTGSVRFDVYLGGTACLGTVTDGGTVALVAGIAHPSLDQVVPVTGLSFRAHYLGDAVYAPADGPCEPLEAIAPTPPTPPTPPGPPTPPAGPSDPRIDVTITKTAPAQVAIDPATGKATITYDVVFGNNGPDTATNVVVVDNAPPGVTYVAITEQPAQGTCSVTAGGTALECALGTLVPGATLAVRFTAEVAAPGTFGSVASANGQGGVDTNLANNAAQASTLVVAALTPPTTKPAARPKPAAKPKPKPVVTAKPKPVVTAKPKPTPKPKPAARPKPAAKPTPIDLACSTLTVAQKAIGGIGEEQVVAASVRQGRKGVGGVRVVLRGFGISVAATTGPDGVVRIPVTPRKAGILRLEIAGRKACNSQRIGVVSVFEPPVTG